jgi:hypothetical protein
MLWPAKPPPDCNMCNGSGNIPTLGTASSAFTVAAVRDDDRVAGFSGAGPAAVSGCSKMSVSSASG